mmetsp:Transcript_12457/g.39819  ORF Transcript_12457/g.39819 Transcript_12457/m.39819 type:complete len:133 (-) Transcript_12457:547-945(-)
MRAGESAASRKRTPGPELALLLALEGREIDPDASASRGPTVGASALPAVGEVGAASERRRCHSDADGSSAVWEPRSALVGAIRARAEGSSRAVAVDAEAEDARTDSWHEETARRGWRARGTRRRGREQNVDT